MTEPSKPSAGTVVISIGIQARSTSERLPGKSSRLIHKKTVVEHVLHAAYKAAAHVNSRTSQKLLADVSLLVPHGDQLASDMKGATMVIESSEREGDVLSRYVQLQKHTNADYVVRITGDCPLIPPFLISRHIFLAVSNRYDYVANVDERCRTSPDGYDCEVLSRRMLEWLDTHAREYSLREHVTQLARLSPPPWIRIGCVVERLDLSHLKLSVDTEEDLDRVKLEHGKIETAIDMAARLFGKNAVHRI